MDVVKVERVDHLGIIASVIQDLGIIGMIDSRIDPDEREEISTGEAIAGMILNSLGFSNRPISPTPQFLSMTNLYDATLFDFGDTLLVHEPPGCEIFADRRWELGPSIETLPVE